MFEFGAGFDDDLFGQTKDRSKKKTLTYEAQILKAKVCVCIYITV